MKKVLIVEDDKYLAFLLKKKLEKEGFLPLVSNSAKKGIEILKKEKPKLVLLDLIFPKEDGFKILKKMKKITKAPILIISNLDQLKDIKRAIRLGAKEYLIKANFTPEKIIAKVKKYLKNA